MNSDQFKQPTNVSNLNMIIDALVVKCDKRKSLVNLSKKIDIPATTLWNIRQGQVTTTNITNVIKIVKEFLSSDNETPSLDDIGKYISQNLPEYVESFKSTYPTEFNGKLRSQEVESFFKDPRTYEIIMLTATEDGVTEEEIREYYGRVGINALEKLVKSKVVVFNEQNVKYHLPEIVNLSQHTNRELASLLIKMNYKPDNSGTGTNYNAILWNKKDRSKVLPQINALLRHTHNELAKIMLDETTHGNDMLWVNLTFDSLNQTQISTEVLQ